MVGFHAVYFSFAQNSSNLFIISISDLDIGNRHFNEGNKTDLLK